jgi:NADH-quinone oxidoreductase subunit L
MEPVFADARHIEVLEHHGEHPTVGLELGLAGVSLLVAFLGIGLAALAYIRQPDLATRLKQAAGPIYGLVFNKYYFDEIYGAMISRPLAGFSRGLFSIFDLGVVDGLVNGVGIVLRAIGQALRPLQSGYVRRYAMIFAIGVVILIGLTVR